MSSGPPTSKQAVQATAIFLDELAVRRHLRMADLLPAMERALIHFSAGKGVQPARSGIGVRACDRGRLISNDSYREGGLEGSFWPHSELCEGRLR